MNTGLSLFLRVIFMKHAANNRLFLVKDAFTTKCTIKSFADGETSSGHSPPVAGR